MSQEPLHNRLVQSIRLEMPNYVSDDMGGFTTQWVLLKQVFAEVIATGAAGGSAGAHPRPTYARYSMTIYPDALITLPLRVVWKGLIMEVSSIEDHHNHMVLQAETEISQ